MGDGCRFQPLIFQGVSMRTPTESHPCSLSINAILSDLHLGGIRFRCPSRGSQLATGVWGTPRPRNVRLVQRPNINFWLQPGPVQNLSRTCSFPYIYVYIYIHIFLYCVFRYNVGVYIYTHVYVIYCRQYLFTFRSFFDHLHFPSPSVDPPGSTTAPTDESPISPGGDTARNDRNEIHMLLDDTM